MSKNLFPEFVAPMMANSVKEPFDDQDWIFEPKLDGYRAIAVIDEVGQPHIWSRNGLTLEIKFPALLKAVRKLKLRSTILDGEIVAIDEEGIGGFTEGKGSRKNLGALLLGAYRNGKLHYFGHSGSGFTEKGRDPIALLLPLPVFQGLA